MWLIGLFIILVIIAIILESIEERFGKNLGNQNSFEDYEKPKERSDWYDF